MAKKVASLYAEIGAKTDKLKSGLDDSKKQITGMGQQFKQLGTLAQGALVTGVGGAAIVAAKELYELGKRGAAVEQTGQSFEFLLDKVDAAPDLLERLRYASRNTVDDMTLMSSTMTLVAGASDDLAKEITQNAPKLLEIAKAANKLNPALGDTAFLYESISTGIKRNSPLILDNLGLVVKIGQANSEFAASIGKTVDQLTAEEKQMALLNATMEAGDQLIAQVGGTVDAAGDDIARMETQWANLKDEIAKGFAPAVADASQATATFLGRLNQKQEAIDALVDAYQAGLIPSQEKYIGTIEALNRNLISAEDVMSSLDKITTEFGNRTGWAAGQMREATAAAADLEAPMETLGEDVDRVAEGMKQFSAQLLFQKVQDQLDPEVAMEVGLAFGVIDDKTLLLNASLPGLIEKFDQSKDGMIDSAEAGAGFTDALVDLYSAIEALPDYKKIDIEVNQIGDGIPLTITEQGGGAIARQSGGPVGMNMPYLVGERGPELFVPSTSGNIVPNNQLMGGDTIIIHNHSAGAAALTNAMVDDRQAARLNASMGR